MKDMFLPKQFLYQSGKLRIGMDIAVGNKEMPVYDLFIFQCEENGFG